jgi:hypothetical protein
VPDDDVAPLVPPVPEEDVAPLEPLLEAPVPEEDVAPLEPLLEAPVPEEEVAPLEPLLEAPVPEEEVAPLEPLLEAPVPEEPLLLEPWEPLEPDEELEPWEPLEPDEELEPWEPLEPDEDPPAPPWALAVSSASSVLPDCSSEPEQPRATEAVTVAYAIPSRKVRIMGDWFHRTSRVATESALGADVLSARCRTPRPACRNRRIAALGRERIPCTSRITTPSSGVRYFFAV